MKYERLTDKKWKEIEKHCYAKGLHFSNQFTEEETDKMIKRLADLEDKIESGGLSFNDNLYKTAFELILQDVYETRLQADPMSCSSCPFMEEIFDECQNQGLYEDCKRQWQKYYLEQAQASLKNFKASKEKEK